MDLNRRQFLTVSATLIISAAAVPSVLLAKDPVPIPIIDGLEVFEVEVDGDDPRWLKIDRERYRYCSDAARAEHFPVRLGKRRVRYVLLSLFILDSSGPKVIAEIARRNLTPPDRATTETVLEALGYGDRCPPETERTPIVGVWKAQYPSPLWNYRWNFVIGSYGGLSLFQSGYEYFPMEYKFVAVVSDELI